MFNKNKKLGKYLNFRKLCLVVRKCKNVKQYQVVISPGTYQDSCFLRAFLVSTTLANFKGIVRKEIQQFPLCRVNCWSCYIEININLESNEYLVSTQDQLHLQKRVLSWCLVSHLSFNMMCRDQIKFSSWHIESAWACTTSHLALLLYWICRLQLDPDSAATGR